MEEEEGGRGESTARAPKMSPQPCLTSHRNTAGLGLRFRYRNGTWSKEAKAMNVLTSLSCFATSMNSLRASLKSFACTAQALALNLKTLITQDFGDVGVEAGVGEGWDGVDNKTQHLAFDLIPVEGMRCYGLHLCEYSIVG